MLLMITLSRDMICLKGWTFLFIRGIFIEYRMREIEKEKNIKKKIEEKEIIKMIRKEKKRDMSIRKLVKSLSSKIIRV